MSWASPAHRRSPCELRPPSRLRRGWVPALRSPSPPSAPWLHFLGAELPDERVAALAFQVERIHHGTPSGIDNTVITYRQPIFFRKAEPENIVEFLDVVEPFSLVIADTGIRSPTAQTVADVRKAWEKSPLEYEKLFDQVGEVVEGAHEALAQGNLLLLGDLMDENHFLLQEMRVSSPELDLFVETARQAGASGAKLCGGGARREHDRPGTSRYS